MPPTLAFWTWLFIGLGGNRAGCLKLFNSWLFLHFGSALILVYSLEASSVLNIAKSVVLPACGILLGMTFAWSGNITALLSSKELSGLSSHHRGGMSEYVYRVQLSILIVFCVCIAWIIYAFGMLTDLPGVHYIFTFLLFFVSSIAVRECWQTILFAQYMTICRDAIEKASLTTPRSHTTNPHRKIFPSRNGFVKRKKKRSAQYFITYRN